ncbi:hypothetical protein [Silvibacterium acidisoli]|uniref:hypothetical protein n=1 Tax=Acidobacteriaceae bacterium ZG23-2 TaxID=2883246 RepID=UPI00406BF8AC
MQNELADEKQLKLPWWGVLCVIFGAMPLFFLFHYFGKASLGRPALYSTAMICIAVAMRWRLRREVWFWATVAAITVLHVLLVLFVPWGTKWVPAIIITPIAIADLYLMLVAFTAVGKLVGQSIPSDN